MANVLGAAMFTVVPAADGRQALQAAIGSSPDVILLTLDLPDVDGLEVLRRLREVAQCPIIVVSERRTEADVVAGLDAGANDYVLKPYSPAELLARIRSHLRVRELPPAGRRLTFPGLVVDTARREVLVDGRPVDLRPREFDLLAYLASAPGQVFSRAQLLEHVWGSGRGYQSEATVTEHIRRIRHAIGDDPDKPEWIRTVHRVGYRFERPSPSAE